MSIKRKPTWQSTPPPESNSEVVPQIPDRTKTILPPDPPDSHPAGRVTGVKNYGKPKESVADPRTTELFAQESPNMDPSTSQGGLLFYTTPKGNLRINVYFHGETAWLTQKAIADLFGVQRPAITKHLKNIFKTGELQEASVGSILERTAADGKNYATQFYNLDAIIAVGYRVNSFQATQFRIWATETLREHITKGYTLDDERMKQGQNAFGKDYFEEMLERIREIRNSERRFYQKITDLYALSVDYKKDAPTTKEFFASVQNKLHWAITGKTAAEIIYDSADASLPHMGLQTWKQSPDGKILKSDVTVAKNYLEEAHIKELNLIVSGYLELAETRARRGIVMKMQDWARLLEQFLELTQSPRMPDKARVTALEARLKAEQEYEVFRPIQDAKFISDFDQEVLRHLGRRPGKPQ